MHVIGISNTITYEIQERYDPKHNQHPYEKAV